MERFKRTWHPPTTTRGYEIVTGLIAGFVPALFFLGSIASGALAQPVTLPNGNPAEEIAALLVESDKWRTLGKLDHAVECAEAALLKLDVHPDLRLSSIALTRIALMKMDQGKLPEAENLSRKALAIVSRAGLRTPDYVVAAGNLASILTAEARYFEAERISLAALKTGRDVLGPASAKYADLLGVRAELMLRKRHLGEAISLLVKERNIQNGMPLDRERLGQTYQNLAVVYEEAGKLGLAFDAIEKAQEIWFHSLPEDNPARLNAENTLLTIYDRTHQYERANAVIATMLPRAVNAFGEDHPHFALILNNIGTVYEHQARHAEAAVAYRRAYQIDARTLGQFHPSTAYALLNYGTTIGKLGQAEEGRALERQARAILNLVH